MVNILPPATVVGIRSVQFSGSDGSSVHGAMLQLTYPYSEYDKGASGNAVASCYASERFMSGHNVVVGSIVDIAKVANKVELVAP